LGVLLTTNYTPYIPENTGFLEFGWSGVPLVSGAGTVFFLHSLVLMLFLYSRNKKSKRNVIGILYHY
jgi:hypothetical protein